MQIPDAAIGSIVASLFAGIVVFLTTVLSKEQKTSEFRQAWIDSLREDLAEFSGRLAEYSSFAAAHRKKGYDIFEKYLLDSQDELLKLRVIQHRIKLRLNMEEHSALYGMLGKYMKDLNDHKNAANYIGNEDAVSDVFLKECERILKIEWRRVKRGETTFWVIKYLALLIIALAVIAFTYVYFNK